MTASELKEKEFERVLKLAEYDIDYTRDFSSLQDLSKLAAHITGTPVSLINLIGSNTQWSVAQYGIDLKQLSREDSICKYTILEEEFFEARNLDTHEDFKDRTYVTGDPKVNYYFGVPIQTDDGHNIGSVCVMDQDQHQFAPEKIEMLKVIARNVIRVLEQNRLEKEYRIRMEQLSDRSRKISHDIRGPIGGIIGLSRIMSEQVEEQNYKDLDELSKIIHKSGESILELADEILNDCREIRSDNKALSERITLNELRDKLETLYQPQALHKNISFSVKTTPSSPGSSFPKPRLLQIIGNMVSNALKFTPENGTVSVTLALEDQQKDLSILSVSIEDNGVGMPESQIRQILNGNGTIESKTGTNAERGFGFGFQLARHLIDAMNGSLSIESEPDQGTSIRIKLHVQTD